MKSQEGLGSRAQEEGLDFATSSIVTKRKLVVAKLAGLGVEGSCARKMKFVCNIFYFPREI